MLFSQQQLQLLLQRLQLRLAVFRGGQHGLLLTPHQLLTEPFGGVSVKTGSAESEGCQT